MGIPTLSVRDGERPRRSEAWTDAMSGLAMPLGSSMGRIWTKDETIAEARNALCASAINGGVDYLFMLGDDVLVPSNTLMTMLDKIGRNYTITGRVSDDSVLAGTPYNYDARASMITGVYWTKQYPPEPYLFNGLQKGTYKDWLVGEFFPVDWAGCDCLLLEVEMLKQIPFPWFSTDWVWEPGQRVSPIATEDAYFYTKARKYGFRVFADTSIQCLHEDRSNGALFGLMPEMVQAGGTPDVGVDTVLVAELGAGLSSPADLFGPKAKIVRFDLRADTKPDIRCDIRAITENHFGKYDYVCAHHVLEHFRRMEAPSLVKHWVQLLKPGGKIVIYVPNVERAMRLILDPPPGTPAGDRLYAWNQIYGDQEKPGAAWQHLNGFTMRKLEALLQGVPGLKDIKVEHNYGDVNLKGTATLEKTIEPEALTDMWQEIIARENAELASVGTNGAEVTTTTAKEESSVNAT